MDALYLYMFIFLKSRMLFVTYTAGNHVTTEDALHTKYKQMTSPVLFSF